MDQNGSFEIRSCTITYQLINTEVRDREYSSYFVGIIKRNTFFVGFIIVIYDYSYTMVMVMVMVKVVVMVMTKKK